MGVGKAFGQLVFDKRGVEDVSQEALAVLAFGENGRKALISDLENGKIENPRAKTVDALRIALNISDVEMAGLYREEITARYFDDIGDYLDFSECGIGKYELDETLGFVWFSHDLPWRFEIVRYEFFVQEAALVVLTTSGSRRPIDIKVEKYLAEAVLKSDFVLDVLTERGPQPAALKKTQLPLKIIW